MLISFFVSTLALAVASASCAPAPPIRAGHAASPSAEASAPSVTTTPTHTSRTITVTMSGDLLWHNSLWISAQHDAQAKKVKGFDFYPQLSGMAPISTAASMAICHNEVPLAPPDGPYKNYPIFAAPPQTVAAVKKMGFDLCTTGSNHSLDEGFDGIKRTLDTYHKAGILTSGTAASATEAETPAIFTTPEGVQVAVVEGTYATNGIPLPHDKPWAVADIAAPHLLARAKAARQAGADIVLVAMHAGDEYQTRPNDQQQRLAQQLTASWDVDLVYGHHVHVVQPITQVNGKWVAYGLGNMVAQHLAEQPRGYEGITTRFTFAEQPDGRFTVVAAEYVPTLVTRWAPGAPARLMQVTAALAKNPTSERLKVAQQRTRKAVHLLGNNTGLTER